MRNIKIIQKYNLPISINVKVQKMSDGGYYAEFPDYPGLFTEASDWPELVYMVTDAVFTYFKVPRKIAKNFSVYYVPIVKPKEEKIDYTKNPALAFHALTSAQKIYGYSSFRH